MTSLYLVNASSNSITVAWNPLPCLQLQSRLESYTIGIMSDTTRMIHELSDLQNTVFTFERLSQATRYVFDLSARYSVNADSGEIQDAPLAPLLTASTFSIPG